MATTEREDDVVYESDPDYAKRSLVMRRRRVASDDEYEEEEERAGADGGRDGEDGSDAEGEKASKESHSNKPNNEWKPAQRPEAVNEDNGHRQNKPRRYSEMNYGQ